MKVMGIDPGYERLGIAVVQKAPDESGRTMETVLFSDCVRTSSRMAMPDRLLELGRSLDRAIRTHEPDAIAMEELYFARNTTTAMLVAEARGVIQYVARASGVPCFQYHPNAIKLAVAGHGGAKKEDIAAMVPRLVSFDTAHKLDDEIDAVAVALTHLAHSRKPYPQGVS